MGLVVVWNTRTCGRCGGTGSYHKLVGSAASTGACYACNGAGRLMSEQTAKNRHAYREWQAQTRPTPAQAEEALRSGRFGRAWTIRQEPDHVGR